MEVSVKSSFEGLQGFYRSNVTREVGFRIDSLKRLAAAIKMHEGEIAQALWEDLRKSPEEAYLTETGIVLGEIRMQIKHIRRWARPRKVRTPLALFPARSRILHEPKGVVLIMSPWNYPFQLAMDPLVGAIAAGNCVALKPSATSAATCRVVKRIITEVFPENYVAVFDGGHEQAAELLTKPFDHIFFTGGASFGRTVMAQAARNLVPVTLELGGKSPCVVDRGAECALAARRIVWGKFMNAGQTCIAPDYLLVHESLKDELLGEIKAALARFYGEEPRQSAGYPRIISDKAFARITDYLNGPGDIIIGGETDAADRYIAPTFMENVPEDAPLMQEEIFGPVMPVMTFVSIEQAEQLINSREKPLALYYFGPKRAGRALLSATTSGGACINETILHIANGRLPFGGVGMSGMGRYHGRYSFETFSNVRAVLESGKPDVKMRYPPYKRFGMLRKMI